MHNLQRALNIWHPRAGRTDFDARLAARRSLAACFPRRLTSVCAACAKEISVTAGTIMRRSHLPLSVWFWAAYLMATHSNGMSALQLQSELSIGSYKTAWLLAMKLRRTMVAPGRSPLSGLI